MKKYLALLSLLAPMLPSHTFAQITAANAINVSRAAADQVKVIIYRDAVDYFAPTRPAHIYINDTQIGTLDNKEFSTVCFAPGNYRIASHLEDALIYNQKNRKNLFGSLQAGETYFLRINTHENAGGELSQVDRSRAAYDLGKLKMQEFSQSSASMPCKTYMEPAPMPMPVPPPVKPYQQSLVLGADGTFAINRYALKDLRMEGRQKIDEALRKIRAENIKITNVNVVGHADRLGSENHNYMLGKNRAETIKSYLAMSGLSGVTMTTDSRGSKEPLVMCDQKNKANLIKCLEPNRRISIEFTGSNM